MWEGILFALQITAVWILIQWLLIDERAGGRAETGLFALRRKRDPALVQGRGRPGGTRAAERPRP